MSNNEIFNSVFVLTNTLHNELGRESNIIISMSRDVYIALLIKLRSDPAMLHYKAQMTVDFDELNNFSIVTPSGTVIFRNEGEFANVKRKDLKELYELIKRIGATPLCFKGQ